jgi:hypothetical protein
MLEADMTREELTKAITEACIEASEALGGRVKGMSCFLQNWKMLRSSVEAPAIETKLAA